MKRHMLWFAVLAAMVVGVSPRLAAQAVYGSIVGTVTDSSGAAVPGAKIIITDLNRQVTDGTTANESGNYLQRSLIVGRYRVRVEAPGFKAYQQEANVSADTEMRIDAKLEVGQVSETVEVTAEAGILRTERSEVANTYNERFVASIPTLTRRFLDLQLMTPGAYNNRGAFTVSAEIASGQFHPAQTVVNGQSNAGSGYMLDGTDNHDAILSMIIIQPTLDSVTEAKVTTVSFDA